MLPRSFAAINTGAPSANRWLTNNCSCFVLGRALAFGLEL
jgi:hypothetical protein